MKLFKKGKYFILPIIGLSIRKIIFDSFITLVFNDDEESYLEFNTTLQVTQYNQTSNFAPNDKSTLILFYDHYLHKIKDAKADNTGNLWLSFENGTEIMIEDGPYENWHYTKINCTKRINSLHVHGGVGRLIF